MVELIMNLIDYAGADNGSPGPVSHQEVSDMHCRVGAQNGCASGNREVAKRASEREAHDKIERSIAYMRENIHQPLQVARLAALVGVSSSHYFALFKRHTGSAPIDFFIRLRMDCARRLLETTSLSV